MRHCPTFQKPQCFCRNTLASLTDDRRHITAIAELVNAIPRSTDDKDDYGYYEYYY